MNETIQFKKQRELGAILTDTFAFIRQNWKSLFGMILKIAGPGLVLLVFAYIFYMQSTLGNIGTLGGGSVESFTGKFFLALFLLFVAGMIYNALLYGTVIYYIKSYINNDGIINKEEVSQGVRKDFLSLLGMSFLVGLMVGVGFIFCLVPGIYLGVVLITVYCVFIFEQKGVIESISYCFDLVKNNWWITFGTVLVMGIIYYVVLIIFQIPNYIYFFIKSFTAAQEVTSDPSSLFDAGYIAISSIGVIAQYLLLVIMVICGAFIYFDLNEKKNFTGTMEQIDSLGERE